MTTVEFYTHKKKILPNKTAAMVMKREQQQNNQRKIQVPVIPVW